MDRFPLSPCAHALPPPIAGVAVRLLAWVLLGIAAGWATNAHAQPRENPPAATATAPAATDVPAPLPLSAVFLGVEEDSNALPSANRREVEETADRSPSDPSPSDPSPSDPAPPSDPSPSVPAMPRPFAFDPRFLPVGIPPAALSPPPTPVPTPTPTPVGIDTAALYVAPGSLARRRTAGPFLAMLPGLAPDRSQTNAEIEIVNEWRTLRVGLLLKRETSPPSPDDEEDIRETAFAPSIAPPPDPARFSAADPSRAPAAESPFADDDALGLGPITILYGPGQGDRFDLPPGFWRVVLRAWHPEPPHPEQSFEYEITELLPRSRYKGFLTQDLEKELLDVLHPIVAETRRTRRSEEALSRLGRPAPAEDAPLPRLGRWHP